MSESIPYVPPPPTLGDEPSLGEQVRSQMSAQVSEDLPAMIEYLGELCEIRKPQYKTASGVFANDYEDSDPVDYLDPELTRILLIPLQERSGTSDDSLVNIYAAEPMRGILMGEAPPERSAITIRRSVERHFYVLKRELLTQTPPLVAQVYLVPLALEEEVLQGPFLTEPEPEPEDDSLNNILANP